MSEFGISDLDPYDVAADLLDVIDGHEVDDDIVYSASEDTQRGALIVTAQQGNQTRRYRLTITDLS